MKQVSFFDRPLRLELGYSSNNPLKLKRMLCFEDEEYPTLIPFKKQSGRTTGLTYIMAKLEKKYIQQQSGGELLPSQRMSAASSEAPSLSDLTMSISELFSIVKGWLSSKLFRGRSNKAVDLDANFQRPRSGIAVPEKTVYMKSELGAAKYRKGISTSSATHRR